jgi:tRNA threonylcarbamoyladenosine biosynthesis protein TsaB
MRNEAQIVELGDARHRFGGFDGVICGSATRHLTDAPLPGVAQTDGADIGTVARLGAVADPSLGKPSPLYLRGPDVRPQAGFAVARA